MRNPPSRPFHHLVVIGASMGGIDATCQLLAGLPPQFPAPLFIVIHIGRGPSLLPTILARCGHLHIAHPTDGEPIQPNRVYVAPPNLHMTIEDARVRLSQGPRENRSRPAIDPLFRTAARAYRSRVIGVLLSGELDDGVAGMFAIKARAGTTIIQDPAEAPSPSMPEQARQKVEIDHLLPVTQIAKLLVRLSRRPTAPPPNPARSVPVHPDQERVSGHQGSPLPFSCPECNGPLFQSPDLPDLYHCLVGHTFSPLSFSQAHADALERALWIAIRRLHERLALTRTLAQKHQHAGETELAERISADLTAIENDLELLKEIHARI